MSLKEIFLKNSNRRYNTIKKVKKENITLTMDPIKKIKENWIVLLGILVIIVGLLLLGFNMTMFLLCLGLIFLFVIVFIFGNKAVLTCDKTTLNIKQGFQQSAIPYTNLKTVFIGRSPTLFLIFPMYSYNIILRYEDNFSFIREFQYSLLCADEEDVEKFISNFEIEDDVNPRYVKYEKRRIILKIVSGIITIILAILLFLYLFRDTNWSNLI